MRTRMGHEEGAWSKRGRTWACIIISSFIVSCLIPGRGTAQGTPPEPTPYPPPLSMPPGLAPVPYPPPLQMPPAPNQPPVQIPVAPLPLAPREPFPLEEQQPKPGKERPNTAVHPHDTRDQVLIQASSFERSEKEQEFSFPTLLPGPNELYRRRLSEAQWQEQQRQDAKRFGVNKKVIFPEPLVLTTEKFKPRAWSPSISYVTPGYVVHDRLLFEQINFERYGWELGVLGPPVQAGTYFIDLAMLPYRLLSRPLDQMDTSAGKYLPGDNVPLMLYPESFSITGLAGTVGLYGLAPFAFK